MKPLLPPNPRNPRVITPERVQSLAKALKAFGDLGGIVFNRRSGQTVGGHQRLAAFQSDPHATIEITTTLLEPDKQGTISYGFVVANGTRYAYREVDWDVPTETAAMMAANKFSGEWEWEGVSKLLQELQTGGWQDIELTGFEQHELDTLLNAQWTPPPIQQQAPEGTNEGKVDKIYLTPSARAALDTAKTSMGEADDAKAVERLALYFNQAKAKA